MITAHLPSGYCLGKLSGLSGLAFTAALVGAILPDFDLAFFYFVDDRAIHHHRYWVHVPAFWAVVAAIIMPFLWRTSFRTVGIAFFAAIFLHLLLDSIGGGIMWLAPASNELLRLTTVPASQSNWLLSFLFHWTFLFELLIWALAFFLFISDRRNSAEKTPI